MEGRWRGKKKKKKKEDNDECVIPREKGAREKGLRRCLLPHCPRLTASNKNGVPPLANVTSYYVLSLLRYPSFFFLAFSLLLFCPFSPPPSPPCRRRRRRRRDGTLVYKTPTRTYSARICMQSISLGNRVTSAHREKEREKESAKEFREENPRDRPFF